ncbi:MAG: quinoprotein dehydrogenase-associated SoxYZ-like carrier [Burkholderiaceae bacterium]
MSMPLSSLTKTCAARLPRLNRQVVTILVLVVLSAASFNTWAVEADNEIWRSIRYSLFKNRPVTLDTTGEVLVLKTPKRAQDSAVVPIGVISKIAQTPERHIQKIWLVVDRNPSPVGAIFTLSPNSGRADIDTRIRVQEFTHIRAIAQLNDGSVYMARNFLRASGGCSAPAAKDMERAMKNIGRMKVNLWGKPVAGKPLRAQLMVSHPNITGLAEQSSQAYSAPHFVRHLEIAYGDEVILQADIDFSISENPNFRFWFTPQDHAKELQVRIVDTEDKKYTKTVAIKPFRETQ